MCIKDGKLVFRTMEVGLLMYAGQVSPVILPEGSNPGNNLQGKRSVSSRSFNSLSSDFMFCGYGKLVWSDGSYFESYWINGQGHGYAFFKANSGEEYSGQWVFD